MAEYTYNVVEQDFKLAEQSFATHSAAMKKNMDDLHAKLAYTLLNRQQYAGTQATAFGGVFARLQEDITNASRQLDIMGQTLTEAHKQYNSSNAVAEQSFGTVANAFPTGSGNILGAM
jgi:uncharacterized protein YukE